MAKLKFSIHPLFFLFGIYFACTGRVFLFLTYTLVAVIHEFGHSIAAARLGYKLNRIVLMPYGAVISGDVRGLKFRDEIEVALAGPLVNLICAVFFVALWWVLPEAYAFTDTAMMASLSIATINLLPCMPLDGGRVLHSFLSLYLKERIADIILKITGVAFSCVLGGLFIVSCFFSPNLSLLFFSLFALFGTLLTGKDKVYVKIYDNLRLGAIECGAEIRRLAVSQKTTVKKLITLLDSRTLSEVEVFTPEGKLLKILSPEEVCTLVTSNSIYNKVGDCI